MFSLLVIEQNPSGEYYARRKVNREETHHIFFKDIPRYAYEGYIKDLYYARCIHSGDGQLH